MGPFATAIRIIYCSGLVYLVDEVSITIKNPFLFISRTIRVDENRVPIVRERRGRVCASFDQVSAFRHLEDIYWISTFPVLSRPFAAPVMFELSLDDYKKLCSLTGIEEVLEDTDPEGILAYIAWK